ncbi:hypothetical protein M413DRAFT_240937 [Hebeloma cylindrosporum]|uniref:Uncharacterized protein n=1 Tax=Hebeloma cylindrosporum TaxID=76867 RepID=A0A0C3C388_HEBCY|nr:hypothetical protein M413DRAFT_240937 [Hebeloma cylindrosporum h7]
MSKRKVAYYYDGERPFSVSFPRRSMKQGTGNSSRRRGLHLWTGAPHEATSNTSNPRFSNGVWDA